MRARSSASLMLALAGLGGICVSVVLAVGFAVDPLETVPAEHGRDPGATADTTSSARAANPLWAVPLSALRTTAERPIFSPSRRPPAPPVIAAQPPPVPPSPPTPQEAARPPLVLVGTAVGGSRRLGVFLEEATKKVIRIDPGEGHSGWFLRRLDRREARFENAHRAAILALQPASGPEPAAGSAPMPARPPVGPQPATGSVDAPAIPRLAPRPQPATASLGASATEPVPAVHHRKR